MVAVAVSPGIVIALRRGLIAIAAPDWRALPRSFGSVHPVTRRSLLSVIYMILTRFTSQFGTPALAALGIGHKMEGLGGSRDHGFSLRRGTRGPEPGRGGQEARARRSGAAHP